MQLKFKLDVLDPIVGEASTYINKPTHEVFYYIGENFFDNYPKWAVEVIQFEPLDGKTVFIGAKAKQTREDNGAHIESVFVITDYQPYSRLTLQGIDEPYKQSYLLEESNDDAQPARLTFRFELLELEVFMRPFKKLIRSAIEDGTENTLENIKKLMTAECN